MSDPFRLRVLKALTAQIKTIRPVNGYMHDLSDFTDGDGLPAARVFRGRDLFGYNDPLPMVSILEDFRPQDGLERNTATVRSVPWKLLIQGFVSDDADNPTDPAHHLAADVIVALSKLKLAKNDILGFGYQCPCVTGILIDTPVVRPPDGEVSSVAFFLLSVTLTIVENTENPFA